LGTMKIKSICASRDATKNMKTIHGIV
jgi:hypothetical protein